MSPSTGTTPFSACSAAAQSIVLLPALLFIAPALAAPHTSEELMRPPEVRSVTMAPDGRRIAFATRVAASPTDSIVVIPADSADEGRNVRRFEISADGKEARVAGLRWVSSKHLVVEVAGAEKPRLELVISGFGQFVRQLNPLRLFSLDVTRGAIVALDARLDAAAIVDDSMAETGSIIAAARGGSRANLYRVNLDTGEMMLHAEGGAHTCCWRVVAGTPLLRKDYVPSRKMMNVFVPKPRDDPGWVLANSQNSAVSSWLARTFVANGPGPTEVYVRARHGDSDTEGIHLFDLAKNKIVSTQAEVAGHDIESALVLGNQFVAANFHDDRFRQLFSDPATAEHYANLERVAGTDNSVEVLQLDADGSHWLVRISGPRLPADYHVYDVARRQLHRRVSERPWLDPERLAPMSVRRVKTRDGVYLDTYLTCHESQNRARAPLLVMPPAGPWTRSSLRFNPAAQAFAAQGWCVVEPNYRGVVGYGKGFLESGYGQWSGQVAEDIVDAVNDVLDAGVGDRDKVAFFAENLAAYAVLIGAMDNQYLYDVGVALTPVMDLDTLVNGHRTKYASNSRLVEDWLEYRGGELRVDSPLVRADALSCPILLIHEEGMKDVPIGQSKAMEKALHKAGRPVDTYWLPDDRTWSLAESNEAVPVSKAIEYLHAHMTVEFADADAVAETVAIAAQPELAPVTLTAPSALDNPNCIQPSIVDREACFGRLRLGMRKSEIIALLGPPAGTSRDGTNLRYGDRYLRFDAADILLRISDKPL